MKRLFLLVILIGFLVGCSDESGVVTPVQETAKTWIKLNTVKPSLAVETTYSVSETIDGKDGGQILANVNFAQLGGEDLKVKCKLKFPKKSFTGTETFTLLLDDQTTTVDLAPTPYSFNKPLKLTLTYKGVNLSGVNPDEVDFYYVSPSGVLVKAEYDKLEVDVDKGKLKVKNALIPHFSRFGFVKAIE